QHAPRARILSVEPSPVALASLRGNVVRNGLSQRVRILAAAAAANVSEVVLVPGGDILDSSVIISTRPAEIGDAASRRIEAVDLRELLHASGGAVVDVLKLDCEGAEYDLLMTSGPDELSAIGCILAEIHPGPGRDFSA